MIRFWISFSACSQPNTYLFLKIYFYMQQFGLWQTIHVSTYMRLPGLCRFLSHFCLVSPMWLPLLRRLGYQLLILFKQIFACLVISSLPFQFSLFSSFSPRSPPHYWFYLPLTILVALLLAFHPPIGLPAINFHPEPAIKRLQLPALSLVCFVRRWAIFSGIWYL